VEAYNDKDRDLHGGCKLVESIPREYKGSTSFAGRTEVWPISLRQLCPYPHQKLILIPFTLVFKDLLRINTKSLESVVWTCFDDLTLTCPEQNLLQLLNLRKSEQSRWLY